MQRRSRLRLPVLLGQLACLGLGLGTAAPAVADRTSPSSAIVSVTVEGGGLSIGGRVDAGKLRTKSYNAG